MHEAMQLHSEEPWVDNASAALQEEQEGAFRDDAELGRLVARELPFYFATYGTNEQEFVRHMLHSQSMPPLFATSTTTSS